MKKLFKLPSITEEELTADPDGIIDRVSSGGEAVVIRRKNRDVAVMMPCEFYRRHRNHQDVIKDKLKDPKFRKEWEATDERFQRAKVAISQAIKTQSNSKSD